MLHLFTSLVLVAIAFVPTGVWASEDMGAFEFEQETIEEFSFNDELDVQEDNSEANQVNIPDQIPEIEQQFNLSATPSEEQSSDNGETVTTSQITPVPNPENELPIDTSATLTDNLKRDETEKPQNPLNDVDKTWIGKLVSPQTIKNSPEAEELSKLLDNARKQAPKNKRSNASVFDISGVMLRMSLEQADKALTNRGFKKTVSKYQIPNFIKWRNEEHCRNSGVVGYERIESCIAQKAKKENHQYVQTVKYAKYDTKEEIAITLTSNFTANRVIKIEYRSQAANKSGNSPKSVYLRNIKIYDFWKTVNQKYGPPDDKVSVIWGMGGNKPFLKAATGYLKLEDPMLKELDYTRMSREDQRYMNTDLYNF